MSHPSRVWIGVAGAVALAVFVLLIGLVSTGLRLAVAGLSPGHGLFVVPIWHSILTGLILTGIGCATFVVSCVAAYVAAWRRWDFHRHDWQDIVEKKGVRSAWDSLHARTRGALSTASIAGPRAKARYRTRRPRSGRRAREQTLAKVTPGRRTDRWSRELARTTMRRAGLPGAADVRARARPTTHAQAVGEAAGPGHVTATPAAGHRLLRILAGFNLLVLAGVIALGVGQTVAAFQSAWWAVVPASVIAFLVVHRILTTLGPLDAHPHVHTLSWVLVAALALLSSPPVGLLVITGAIISTWGRNFVRANASQPLALRLRSPLPWLMAGAVRRGRRRLSRDATGVVRRRDRPDRLGTDHRRQPGTVG